MQVSLRKSPRVCLENYPNYRVVQVSDRSGDVGMLLPHANLVVPDKRAIRNLKEIIQLYEKLKPSEPFNYGTSSGYRKYPKPPPLSEEPAEINRTDDLPLFGKQG